MVFTWRQMAGISDNLMLFMHFYLTVQLMQAKKRM